MYKENVTQDNKFNSEINDEWFGVPTYKNECGFTTILSSNVEMFNSKVMTLKTCVSTYFN